MSTSDCSNSPPITSGFCQCGCGQETRPAQRNNQRLGLKKGQPQRYLPGHHTRLSPVDYIVQDRGFSSPCWIWQLQTTKSGYGKKGIKGTRKKHYAHRLYYEQSKGPIPNGLSLDHLCRNPACVNPDHLEPVTHAQNMQRGNNTRLTAPKVKRMRKLASQGVTGKELAQRFALSKDYVYRILRGEYWKGV